MRVGNYSVLIPEGRERDSEGHVVLSHGTQYHIRLGNHDYGSRCDAELKIDGKDMGSFRIQAGQTITLERPVNETGKFTFFESGSAQAAEAGGDSVSREDRGLLTVIFRPEKKRIVAELTSASVMKSASRSRGCGQSAGGIHSSLGAVPQNCSAGITGLTGHSTDQYTTVQNLDYALNEEVTIHLRLVCGSDVRPLSAVSRSNPIPPPVD